MMPNQPAPADEPASTRVRSGRAAGCGLRVGALATAVLLAGSAWAQGTAPRDRVGPQVRAPGPQGDTATAELPAGLGDEGSTALFGLLQERRGTESARPLLRSPALDAVARGEAERLSRTGTGQPDGQAVRRNLTDRMYIPMLDATVAARAGDDPAAVLALLEKDPATASALTNTAYEEVGMAREPNPKAQGVNDAYVWVLILAKPLRAPPEDPNSPRKVR